MLRHVIEDLLSIEPAGADRFRAAKQSDVFDRVYGGQMLAQGLRAAAATVDGARPPNSAHCYFLRLGDPTVPLEFHVERVRETRTFSNRLVRAQQNDHCVCLMMFSFCAAGEGLEHQWAMPDAPAPETLASRDEQLIAIHGDELPLNAGVPWPVDIRHVNRRPWDPEIGEGRNLLWMRADDALPDDPLLHACLLLYASDLTMAEAATARHPIRWEDLIAGRGIFGASLDHSFWLHQPVRFDDWLLHVQESSRGGGGRGFTTGRFFDRGGRLIASVAQEIFIKETTEGSGR
ncbi:Acyl-CoA thioesterase 2 [Terricaulis silvestris]|uniref:Acyl-CoA thioesterase 2 n=2 Tax=Terricaulis silvestris TaxID=2686094 RepID=A0A6I6MIZ1_9CAUL|nr:Acyl-CoA thioesterase 2 [Terricaulis silvestris]